MKKIAISLGIIGVVAAIVIGATTAYFSDTETSTKNTFSAGTIDIAIDGTNPWTSYYDVGDLKPGETGYINFDITNVGQNPVNVSKNVGNFQESTGIVSEPECTDQGGYWDNPGGGCNWNWDGQESADENDIQSQIIYDLSVKVYAGEENELLWWQTIYSVSNNKRLTDVYGDNKYVVLGMIPVGGHMEVTQSYHFSEDAGNAYQGDKLSFDITIKGDQLMQAGGATVTLENKTRGESDEWSINQDDEIQGLLTYQTKGSEFDYGFTASGLENRDYQLIYYPDPWISSKQVVLIGDVITVTNGSIDVSNSVELGMDLPNSDDANYPEGAKIWLVPATSLSNSTLSWTNTDKFLFETRLITYDDTDL